MNKVSSPQSAPSASPGQPIANPMPSALAHLLNIAASKAKSWAASVILLHLFIFSGGILSIFSPAWSLAYPYIAFPIAALSGWLSLRSAQLKSRSEQIKRHLEYLDGLGVGPTQNQMANIRAELPESLSADVNPLLAVGVSYSSVHPPGLKRLLENLSESAFFSHHLARKSAYYLSVVVTAATVISISALFFCLRSTSVTSTAVDVSRAIAVTLAFIISIGSIKNIVGYLSFSSKAENTLAEATRALSSAAAPEAIAAYRLASEYQLARAGAPHNPTWVWHIHRAYLNKIWAERNTTK